MNDMHGNSAKNLRQNLLAQRKQFAAAATYPNIADKLQRQLAAFLVNQGALLNAIALYVPIQDEIDLRPTLLAWEKGHSSRKLLLPFARADQHLDFYLWKEGDALSPSRHGVPEPDPSNTARPQHTPDCILIPCVGWSQSTVNGMTRFWRLGYGGGYFDRTLSVLRQKNPNLLCLGIGFDWQELNDAQWAPQTHDEPLDLLLTESTLLG